MVLDPLVFLPPKKIHCFLVQLLIESRYLKGVFKGQRKKLREKTKVVQKRRAKRAFWPSDGEQCGKAADQAKKLVFLRRAEQTCELRTVAAQGVAAAQAQKRTKKKLPIKIDSFET